MCREIQSYHQGFSSIPQAVYQSFHTTKHRFADLFLQYHRLLLQVVGDILGSCFSPSFSDSLLAQRKNRRNSSVRADHSDVNASHSSDFRFSVGIFFAPRDGLSGSLDLPSVPIFRKPTLVISKLLLWLFMIRNISYAHTVRINPIDVIPDTVPLHIVDRFLSVSAAFHSPVLRIIASGRMQNRLVRNFFFPEKSFQEFKHSLSPPCQKVKFSLANLLYHKKTAKEILRICHFRVDIFQ